MASGELRQRGSCSDLYIRPAVVTCLELCCSHLGLPVSGPAPSGYSPARPRYPTTQCERGCEASALAGTPNAESGRVTSRMVNRGRAPRSTSSGSRQACQATAPLARLGGECRCCRAAGVASRPGRAVAGGPLSWRAPGGQRPGGVPGVHLAQRVGRGSWRLTRRAGSPLGSAARLCGLARTLLCWRPGRRWAPSAA